MFTHDTICNCPSCEAEEIDIFPPTEDNMDDDYDD